MDQVRKITDKNAVLFWSGGKDAAFALWVLQKENQLNIKYLVTTINRKLKRVSMHGLREEVLEKQVHETGYPLIKMYVDGGSNADYEANLSLIIKKLKREGIDKIVFGDIFLQDLRDYRDKILQENGVEGIYPLWKKDTTKLRQEMKMAGFQAAICCINASVLNKELLGKELSSLTNTLPNNIDACGENGEFHTFCYNGPVFKSKIEFKLGEKVFKPLEINPSSITGFWFIDIE